MPHFHGEISEKISYCLTNKSLRIGFKLCSNIFQNLVNKDKLDILDKNGAYSLSCGDCAATYIGQTGRKFETRFNKHLLNFKYIKENSNYAKHFIH